MLDRGRAAPARCEAFPWRSELGYAVKLAANGALLDRLIAVVAPGCNPWPMDEEYWLAYGETVGIDGGDGTLH